MKITLAYRVLLGLSLLRAISAFYPESAEHPFYYNFLGGETFADDCVPDADESEAYLVRGYRSCWDLEELGPTRFRTECTRVSRAPNETEAGHLWNADLNGTNFKCGCRSMWFLNGDDCQVMEAPVLIILATVLLQVIPVIVLYTLIKTTWMSSKLYQDMMGKKKDKRRINAALLTAFLIANGMFWLLATLVLVTFRQLGVINDRTWQDLQFFFVRMKPPNPVSSKVLNNL